MAMFPLLLLLRLISSTMSSASRGRVVGWGSPWLRRRGCCYCLSRVRRQNDLRSISLPLSAYVDASIGGEIGKTPNIFAGRAMCCFPAAAEKYAVYCTTETGCIDERATQVAFSGVCLSLRRSEQRRQDLCADSVIAAGDQVC